MAAPVSAILFYLFAALAVAGALGTALANNPRRAAAGLALAMAALAAIFLLLDAQFLAAVQLLVWVGPTVLLFGVGHAIIKPKEGGGVSKPQIFALAGLIAAMIVVLAWLFIRMPWEPAASGGVASPSLQQLAAELLSARAPGGYLVVFLLLSLVILVVMVGGAYLARPRRETPREAPTIETLSPSLAARERSKR
jgi:NADH-quinone oxidoreductase subunit J